MKHIFLNLKRFDIPREYGGVNGVAPMEEWGSYIVQNTQEKLKAYGAEDVEFVMYFPEAHLIPAVKALCEDSPVKIGCQECTGTIRLKTAISAHLPPTALPTRLKQWDAVPLSSATARSERIRPEF